MAGNSIGKQFRITTWGESHGPAIGVIVDGCPAGLRLTSEVIQKDLDRRRVGQSQITSQRKEPDRCQILSGVFEGKTTGAPIHIEIENRDSDSKAYEDIKELFRPGHGDYAYAQKYGIRDWRGGGRASARETACRVAAGAIAREFLLVHGITVFAHTIQIHDIKVEKFEKGMIEQNDIRCADSGAATKMIERINEARKDGDSVGGVIEVRAHGVPAGLGEPVYDRFDADLAKSLMSINAVKGVEIGSGFSSAQAYGSANNDNMRVTNGTLAFESNHSGGIDAGITNGNIIVARIAVKPTPSILKSQITIDAEGNETTISVEGRHDPCICPRAVPVAEAMMLITLADHFLRNRSTGV